MDIFLHTLHLQYSRDWVAEGEFLNVLVAAKLYIFDKTWPHVVAVFAATEQGKPKRDLFSYLNQAVAKPKQTICLVMSKHKIKNKKITKRKVKFQHVKQSFSLSVVCRNGRCQHLF